VLDAWTPAIGDGARRPVLVWLHGGAFLVGSGGSPCWDGARLARAHDVVVVTVSHRLGALGFLHLAGLGGGLADAGMAGMLDLLAALRWVREHAAALGGDPDLVTILGQSGGGVKVAVLTAMPAARGLFHRAVVQSGPPTRVLTADVATGIALHTLRRLGVRPGSLDALRTAPLERLLAAQTQVIRASRRGLAGRGRRVYGPVVDGHHLPALPDATAPPDVPLLIGTTADEASIYLPEAAWVDRLDGLGPLAAAHALGGRRGGRVARAYRRRGASPRERVVAMASDRALRIPSLALAERWTTQGGAPAFVYRFDWRTPVEGGRYGAAHGLDVPFLFDTLDAVPEVVGPAPPRALVDVVQGAWVAFARRGVPELPGLSWPPYEPATRATMLLDVPSRLALDPGGAARRAWGRG
jgi:para-nitrobenzyl esterase